MVWSMISRIRAVCRVLREFKIYEVECPSLNSVSLDENRIQQEKSIPIWGDQFRGIIEVCFYGSGFCQLKN